MANLRLGLETRRELLKRTKAWRDRGTVEIQIADLASYDDMQTPIPSVSEALGLGRPSGRLYGSVNRYLDNFYKNSYWS